MLLKDGSSEKLRKWSDTLNTKYADAWSVGSKFCWVGSPLLLNFSTCYATKQEKNKK